MPPVPVMAFGTIFAFNLSPWAAALFILCWWVAEECTYLATHAQTDHLKIRLKVMGTLLLTMSAIIGVAGFCTSIKHFDALMIGIATVLAVIVAWVFIDVYATTFGKPSPEPEPTPDPLPHAL